MTTLTFFPRHDAMGVEVDVGSTIKVVVSRGRGTSVERTRVMWLFELYNVAKNASLQND